MGRASMHHLLYASSAQAWELHPAPWSPAPLNPVGSSQGRRGALPGIQLLPAFFSQVEALLGDHLSSPRVYQQWWFSRHPFIWQILSTYQGQMFCKSSG